MTGALVKLLIGIVLLLPGGLLAAPAALWWLRQRRAVRMAGTGAQG